MKFIDINNIREGKRETASLPAPEVTAAVRASMRASAASGVTYLRSCKVVGHEYGLSPNTVHAIMAPR